MKHISKAQLLRTMVPGTRWIVSGPTYDGAPVETRKRTVVKATPYNMQFKMKHRDDISYLYFNAGDKCYIVKPGTLRIIHKGDEAYPLDYTADSKDMIQKATE